MKKFSLGMSLGISLALLSLSACTESTKEAAARQEEKFANYTSDAIITSKIKTKFLANESLKAFDIGVSTTNGIVALSGTVPDHQVKNIAMRIAVHTQGVHLVNGNALHIRQ